jgi:TP53 regulating kinase-like protein
MLYNESKISDFEKKYDLLAEGAEAKIYKINKNILRKYRLEKPYRLKEIDISLRNFRTRREVKVLNKLYENGVNVPKVISFEKDQVFFDMEYIKGNSLKEVINKELLFIAFEEIIKMHNLDIVHHDLTTLNMHVFNDKIYLIDFGLSQFSKGIEEKAVDLNLFFNCIKNEHPEYYKYKGELMKIYISKAKSGDNVIERLKNIELRGRNKQKIKN